MIGELGLAGGAAISAAAALLFRGYFVVEWAVVGQNLPEAATIKLLDSCPSRRVISPSLAASSAVRYSRRSRVATTTSFGRQK